MKRWTQIFKALANSNRLSIIQLLSDGKERHVSDIAASIHVSLPGTSRHLILLSNLDLLDSLGKDGHVYYSVNSRLPEDLRRATNLFLRR